MALAPHCAGGLAFMTGRYKRSRDPRTAALQTRIGVRRDVFGNLAQMEAFHSRAKRREP